MNAASTLAPTFGIETDTTDETYSVGNHEFLLAVFGTALTDARPLIVSFDGDPTKVASKAWFGRPWQADSDPPVNLSATANNYFSLATFKPDEAGKYRRQKARFEALHAVMLDDVGTKSRVPGLKPRSTWHG